MSRHIPAPMGWIAHRATLLVCGFGIAVLTLVPTNMARADKCLTAPNSPAPDGSHWYYQTDRATQLKCWYLRALGHAKQPAAQAALEPAPAATASDDAPMAISPGGSAQPNERIRQKKAAASQADTSSQTSAQTVGPPAGVSVGVPTNIARPDKCLTAPNSPAPEGSHWYYQTDRATQRKCWYLRALAQPTQPVVQASETVPTTHPDAINKSATASAGAPMLTTPDDNAPPIKPQLAPMSSATTNEIVQQTAQEGSMGPSIPQASPSQTSASSHVNVQAAGLAPSPPVITMLKLKVRRVLPGDGHAHSAQPMVTARAPDNSQSTARGSASTAKINENTASISTTPVEMFLVIAFGLTATGLLYHAAMRSVAVRRRQVVVEHPQSDVIDDRNQHESRGDKWQHCKSLDERDRLIDDLHRSHMQGASDDRAHRSTQTDGEWRNSAHQRGGGFQIAEKVSEREDRLEQLKRDLDRLLQFPKRA